MAHPDARLRQQLLELLAHRLDGADLVVQEVHLAAPLQFAQHGFADQSSGERLDEGLHRQTLLRCRGDCGKVAYALERHRECARDRRGGEGQHVDFGAQRLQLLLLAHAEAVFLVDDDEAEAGEFHVFLDQPMGADDDVDATFLQALQGRSLLLGGAEAGQLGDLHGPGGEAIAELEEMLFGQQRRRHQHRHLLAAHHRHERGAQGDLRLAEADIAADQAVHRPARAHVGDDRGDGGGLIGRFLEAEAFDEGVVIVHRTVERMALAGSTSRVEVEQLGGSVARCLERPAACLFPLPAAEPVQRGRVLAGATVAGDQVQAGDRHVELVAAVIFEVEKFGHAVAEIERGEPEVTADAVLGMDHGIAGLEFGKIAQQVVHRGRPRFARPPEAGGNCVKLGLGDDGEPPCGVDEAGSQRSVGEAERFGCRKGRGPVIDEARMHSVLGEVFGEGFASPG